MQKKFFVIISVLLLAAACSRAPVNYGTQQACEKATGKSCILELCDIPPCPSSSNKGWLPVSKSPSTGLPKKVSANGISLEIEPSVIMENWVVYPVKGASIVVKGHDLKSVEIRLMPTGTGIGEIYPNGVVLGQAVNSKEKPDEWRLPIQPNQPLMTTNLWVMATTTAGSYIKGPDLGNVVEAD